MHDGPHLMALYSHIHTVFELHDIVCYLPSTDHVSNTKFNVRSVSSQSELSILFKA